MSSMAAAAAAAAAASASSRLAPALAAVSLTDLLASNSTSLWKLKLDKAPSALFTDFSRFRNALEQNTTVTSVELKWSFLRNLSDTNRKLLLGTIGTLPQLSEIYMDAGGPTSVLVAVLQNATQLKCLRVEQLRLSSNRDVERLADALKRCSSLQSISLSSFQAMVNGSHIVDNEGMIRFQETMPSEHSEKIVLDPLFDAMASLPRLEHIRLQHYLDGTKIQPACDSSLRSLCQSPRKSLIFNQCGLSDQQCFAIAGELKSSKSNLPLSILVVTRNYGISPRGWDAFVEMLEHNYNIVDFHHGEDGQPNEPSGEQLAKMKYFTELNVAGRGQLLLDHSMAGKREAWVDFIVQGTNDIDHLFFALGTNPSLCHV